MTALAAAGYHAIAPDMRGYGETEAPATVAPLLRDMVGRALPPQAGSSG